MKPRSEREQELTAAGQAITDALRARRSARVALGRAVSRQGVDAELLAAVAAADTRLAEALEALEALL